MKTRFLALIALTLAFLAAPQLSQASIITYDVSFDTAFLPDPSYDLDFQFTQGDPAEIGSNTASVTNLSIPGSSDFEFGDGNPPFTGEEDVNFTPGDPVTFTLAITDMVTSEVTPDLLAITIYDNVTGNPVITTDPNTVNSSLIYFTESIDPANPGISLAAYDTPTNDFQTTVTLEQALTETPEPGTFALGFLCCLLPLFRGRLRKSVF